MVRRIPAAALALLMLLCVCASAEEAQIDPVYISLWGEPASGYEWVCEYEDNGVLDAPIQEYVAGADGSSSGSYDFYFGVRAPGRVQLTFSYGATWGIEPPVRSALCSVTVREDGSRDVRWAECFTDDHLVEVRLPSNPTTGWNWSYAGDSAGSVTLLREDYAPLYENLDGAGGVTTYELQVDAPGETQLLFNYANRWDPFAAAEESYVLRLMVSEEMEISMSVDDALEGLELLLPVDEAE